MLNKLFAISLSVVVFLTISSAARGLENSSSTIAISCFSQATKSYAIQQAVVLESNDQKLYLIVASQGKRIANTEVTLYFFGNEIFRQPSPIVLNIPISDWNHTEYISWFVLDKYCTESQISYLRSYAVQVPNVTADWSNQGLVEILAERQDGMRVPVRVKCPVSTTLGSSDIGVLQLKWTADCLGSPVFSFSADKSATKFLGIVSNKHERGFEFITVAKMVQLLGGQKESRSPIVQVLSDQAKIARNRAETRIPTGITLVSVPPSLLAVCSTQSLDSNQLVQSNGNNQLTSLLTSLRRDDSLRWTHGEYALSYRILLPGDYSGEDWKLLESISYELPNFASESLKNGHVESVDQYGVKYSECLMSHSPSLSSIGLVTSQLADIEVGRPLFEMNSDQTIRVSGFVVDTLRYPVVNFAFKDALCGGRYMPVEGLLSLLPSTLTERYELTSTKPSGLNFSNYCCLFKFHDDEVNGCIARTNAGLCLVTAKHALGDHIDEDFQVLVPYQTKKNFLFQLYAGFTLNHATWKWQTNKSDLAVLRINIDYMDPRFAEAVNQAALVLDEQSAAQLEASSDVYVVTNWQGKHFVYRNAVTSGSLLEDGFYKRSVFGIYPGLLRGTSGSPVIRIIEGVPNLAGVAVQSIATGNNQLMNFCVSSSEVYKLILPPSQYALPP